MMSEDPRIDERRIRVLWNPNSGRKGGPLTNRASRTMLLDLLSRHGLGDELLEPGSEEEATDAAIDAVLAETRRLEEITCGAVRLAVSAAYDGLEIGL